MHDRAAWEYDIQQFPVTAMRHLATDHHLDDFNLRGREGWELAGFAATPAGEREIQQQETALFDITCIWKRPR